MKEESVFVLLSGFSEQSIISIHKTLSDAQEAGLKQSELWGSIKDYELQIEEWEIDNQITVGFWYLVKGDWVKNETK